MMLSAPFLPVPHPKTHTHFWDASAAPELGFLTDISLFVVFHIYIFFVY